MISSPQTSRASLDAPSCKLSRQLVLLFWTVYPLVWALGWHPCRTCGVSICRFSFTDGFKLFQSFSVKSSGTSYMVDPGKLIMRMMTQKKMKISRKRWECGFLFTACSLLCVFLCGSGLCSSPATFPKQIKKDAKCRNHFTVLRNKVGSEEIDKISNIHRKSVSVPNRSLPAYQINIRLIKFLEIIGIHSSVQKNIKYL